MANRKVYDCLLCALAMVSSLWIASCNRFDPSDPPPAPGATGTQGGGASGTQIVIEHPLFAGLQSLVAGDGELHLAWDLATDDVDSSGDIFYRVFLAAGPGDQDFSTPDLVTTAGTTTAKIDGLVNGEAVYVVVRAIDQDGNEDPNRVEWFAVPNRVVYVNRSATDPTVDGTTPATAYRTVTQAIAATISAPDVNIFVAQGVYSENAFLFPGMFLYGGFDGGFDFSGHDPDTHLTQLSIVPSPFTVNVVTMVGEEDGAPMGIDGFQLDGSGSADNIIKIEDAHMRVSNCAIRNAQAHGLEILTSLDKLLFVEGFVRGCAIVDNGAEGIAIHALADLKIDDNLIEGNTNEGIESQWLLGIADGDSRIDITRNRIQDNGDEGVDLDLAEVSELDPAASVGARIRVLVRSNIIRNNMSTGVQIDVDFEDTDGIDARCRIEDNEIVANAMHGIALDADAQSSFRVARNVINGNRASGMLIHGSASGPIFRILHDRILGNGDAGITMTGLGLVDIRHSVLRGNRSAVSSDVGQVHLRNCVVLDHVEESAVTSISHSIASDTEFPSHVQGAGVFEDDPRFESHPLGFFATSTSGTGSRVPLADTSDWQVGDVLELDDDGIAREVTTVSASEVFVDPAPGSVSFGQVVFRFAPGASVVENETLLSGSSAIDGGDPLEVDRDGSRADLGPRGGDTPGNVGVETGIPAESAALEVVAIDPSAGLPVAGGTQQSIRFNRALPVDFESSLTVRLNGIPQSVSPSVTGSLLEFGPVAGALTGDVITVEITPSENIDPVLSQNAHIEERMVVAGSTTDTEPNDASGDAQSLDMVALATGTVSTAIDVDYYSVELGPGDQLSVQLLAGQLESPLAARVSIEDDLGNVLESSAAAPPLVVDPEPLQYDAVGSETVFLRVESANGLGGTDHDYVLVVEVTEL